MNMVWDAFWVLVLLCPLIAFIVVALKEKSARKKAAAAMMPAVSMEPEGAGAVADAGSDFPNDGMGFDDFK